MPLTTDQLDAQTIDTTLQEQLGAGTIAGVSVAVMHRGELVFAQGYGHASIERNVPVTPRTRFAIGSVTKQFTCAIILKLAEAGRLSISHPVSSYYPHLTRADDITLLDLMNHVSGYRDYYPLDFVERKMQAPIAPDNLIDAYCLADLDFEPGSQGSYSNTNYILLARIAERVTGTSFGNLLSQEIFAPLGLKDTTYEPYRRAADYARGYTEFALSNPEPALREGTGWIGGAGAIHSTPADLAKWDLALMSGGVVNSDSYRIMTAPRTLTSGGIWRYGCGLAIAAVDGVTVLQHNGGVDGFRSMNRMVPATQSALITCVNFTGGFDLKANELLFPALLPTKDSTCESKPATETASSAPSVVQAIPDVAGDTPGDAARKFFLALQKGDVSGADLGDEFRHYLNRKRVAGAASRLQPLGELTGVQAGQMFERGGMGVCNVEFTVGTSKLGGLMYRTPDGKIQQLFVHRRG